MLFGSFDLSFDYTRLGIKAQVFMSREIEQFTKAPSVHLDVEMLRAVLTHVEDKKVTKGKAKSILLLLQKGMPMKCSIF